MLQERNLVPAYVGGYRVTDKVGGCHGRKRFRQWAAQMPRAI
jgi:hypothetical protein